MNGDVQPSNARWGGFTRESFAEAWRLFQKSLSDEITLGAS